MGETNILISIIIPVYNSGFFLRKTIISVIEQSYKNWELILIDDCSSDNSMDIVTEFCKKDSRIKSFRLEKNSGAAKARNLGILKAKGEYIAFLDSDDNWHPQKLEKQLTFMQDNQINFSYTDYNIINESTKKETVFKALKDHLSYKDIVRFNYIACSTVMINFNASEKLYMPDIRNRQDWGLWIIAIKKIGEAKRLNIPLTNYYKRANSLSSNKVKMIKYHWYIYHHHLKFNLAKSVSMIIQNIILHIKAAIIKKR